MKLLVLLILLPFMSFGQKDSTFTLPHRYNHTISHHIGIIPTARFGRSNFYGGEMAFIRVNSMGSGWTMSGIGLGYETNFSSARNVISLSGFIQSFAIIGGVDGRLSLNYSTLHDYASLSLRPELGINIMFVNFNYGYDFHFSDPEKKFNRSNFSLSIFIPIYALER